MAMPHPSSDLQARYLDCCRKHNVLPSQEVVSWTSEAEFPRSEPKQCKLDILLDRLRNIDFAPLLDLILSTKDADIDAVDIRLEAHCNLHEEQIMSLIRAADQSLNAVHLFDMSLTGDLSRSLLQEGSGCRVLRLNVPHLQKLENVGKFMKLQTLNLDFCTSLNILHKDCFSLMPSLERLSMCETRVADLWITVAALSKLPSLVELRFQNCLCCTDTGPCPAFSSRKKDLHHLDPGKFDHLLTQKFAQMSPNEMEGKDLSRDKIGQGFKEPTIHLKKYSSNHPSPICFEKHYRQFMIVSLAKLEVLDNLPIDDTERQRSHIEFSKHNEYLPYRRKQRESILSILHDRETNSSRSLKPSSNRKIPSQRCFSRSISAAKFGSSPWPLQNSISNTCVWKEDVKKLRPRQFEYHPSNPSLMAFGTLDGEVVVINHENGKLVNYMPSLGSRDRILGLCWLKRDPSKVLSGSDRGSLKLFNINHSWGRNSDPWSSSNYVKFDSFEQLTSVHVNSTDEMFLVSGYSKNVALYDIDSGKRLQIFTDLHRESINVAKFAHHSPFLFATASFDHDVKMWDLRQNMARPCYTATSARGNVMTCFSPDDLYLLVSSVDNEVKQLLAVDGRVHTDFGIAGTGSSHNYTRSYYMNGRDYVISGSCDEKVVRVCCAQTGRRLRDVYLEGNRSTGQATFVQSLRGDPFRDFNMSILAAYSPSSSKCEIVKVNLHASGDSVDDNSHSEQLRPPSSLGG